VERFEKEGLTDIGVIQANHLMTDASQPIQIASVQTLARRQLPLMDVAVIDEAHRWYDFYGRWMALPEWQDRPIIGLSATPWTRGLGKHYDDLIIAATTKELQEQGYLCGFRVFAPSHPDLRDVRTVAGDYHEGDLSVAMDNEPLVADVVATWLERGEGRPTFCFAVDCAHARHLRDRFEQAGVRAAYMDAFTSLQERAEIRDQFHTGEIEVVCNVGVLTTGIDWDVRCIILARPTKSEILFVQIIGRGLRTAPGKTDCRILDHSDTHARLGFVTDIHHDTLDDGQPREKAESRTSLPKECPKCAYLRPPRISRCPNCGYEPKAPVTTIRNTDGQLIEITNTPRLDGLKPEDMAAWYAMLKQVAVHHRYKPGWSAHKFKEKFGFFPPAAIQNITPTTPTAEVTRWVKSRRIAYAKAVRKSAMAATG
jgi:superfamily II DNA or RNA helicase